MNEFKVRPLQWMHKFAARKKFQKLYFTETNAIYRLTTTPLFTVCSFDFINKIQIFHSIQIKGR